MQDETSQASVGLMIQGGKISAQILRQAIRDMMAKKEKAMVKIQTVQEKREQTEKKGEQSLRSLMDQGAQLYNIRISEENIGEFEQVARRYEIDYSLKKDMSRDPPCYWVFFKARDEGVLDAALEEFLEMEPREQRQDRVNVHEKLTEKRAQIQEKALERSRPVRKHRELSR